MKKVWFVVASPFLVLLAFSGTAQAINIWYEVTDLPDITPGDDLWKYTYYMSDYVRILLKYIKKYSIFLERMFKNTL